ncbi:MAG: NAD(P)H-dependent glycerol-3-phosphate dehydrogenase [Bacillota bacterium]
MLKNNKITIIGGGSWGTAIAYLLANNNFNIKLYVRDKELKNNINQQHINNSYFSEKKLPENIIATTDLENSIKNSKTIILSVPTDATRQIMKSIKEYLKDDQIIISTAKGIEENSYLRNSEIIKKMCTNKVAVLSGPTHAEEVIHDLPSAAVIAAKERRVAENVQDMFMSKTFRVYTNPDVVGVEMGGAIKNIIAIAAGIADGLGYGDNSLAALMTRGLTEISRLGTYFDSKLLTFAGLSGMGDLVVTCTSKHSRNRRFGYNIGKGMNFSDALNKVGQSVEGIKTTKAVKKWMEEENFNFDLPITNEIYKVLFENKNPLKAVDDLMLRGPKHEMEEVVENKEWK